MVTRALAFVALAAAVAACDYPDPPDVTYPPPTPGQHAVTATEDTPLPIPVSMLLQGDTDPSGLELSVTEVSNAEHGTVALSGTTITFTPEPDYPHSSTDGITSFDYTLSNGDSTSTAHVAVTVTAVNDAPVAANDTATTPEDTALVMSATTLLANDTDADGDVLLITSVVAGTHCTATMTGASTKLVPDANYHGPATFTYHIDDGHGGTSSATVTVNVATVDDPPVAVDDSATTAEDTATAIDVLANDSDLEGDTLTVASVTQPAHGAVTLSGSIATYTPAADYNGSDAFTYTVSDGTTTSTATVAVAVTPVNDRPIAVNDALTTAEDTAGKVALLANDTDVDGDTLVVTSHTSPAHGVVSIDATGLATYTPNANYHGPDSFQYTAGDGALTATATASITVTSVNDAPVASTDTLRTAANKPGIVDVLANDTDADGDALSVTAFTQGGHGTVAFAGSVATYTPAAGFTGSDTFHYTVSDGNGGTVDGTVNVSVSFALGFAPHVDVNVGFSPVGVTFADLNGDGKPDLVAASDSAPSEVNRVSVLLNTTPPGVTIPTFAPRVDFATQGQPFAVVAVDLDGDGVLDLAVTNLTGRVSLFRNTTPVNAPTPSFATRVDLVAQSGTLGLAAADFDGDGKPDLAAVNSGTANVSVFLNTTTGSALSFTRTNFGVGSGPDAIAVADLDRDGHPDLAITNRNDATVSILRNTSTGPGVMSFAAKQDVPVGHNPLAIAAGDFDGDGAVDLATADFDDLTFSLVRNTSATGAIAFAARVSTPTLSKPAGIAAVDLDSDGKPEVVISNSAANTVSVFANTTTTPAATSFAIQPELPSDAQPGPLAIADVNGDGKPDLVGVSGTSPTIWILPAGTTDVPLLFTPPAAFAGPSGAFATSVVTTDFNGDGRPDFAFTDETSDLVSVYLDATVAGAKTATLSARGDFATGARPVIVRSADFDGDGRPDLVVANVNAQTVSVLLDRTATSATTPTFTAKVDFATGAMNDVAVGDFDGDGKPDIAVAVPADDSIGFLFNTTAVGASVPTFAPLSEVLVGDGPRAMASLDINQDGRDDIAVVCNGNFTVLSVILSTTAAGQTTASFTPEVEIPAQLSVAIASGDFDRDGRQDLAMTNHATDVVSILINSTAAASSTPSFAPAVVFPTGDSAQALVVADVNGDGVDDIVASNALGRDMSVLVNETPVGGGPVFAPKIDFPSGPSPREVVVCDVNGDGEADIVATDVTTVLDILLGR